MTATRHRAYLADRNADIPVHLPAVWAALGQHIRAEALARSIPDQSRQAQALAAVAVALARAGQPEQAVTLARSIPWEQVQALAAVAQVLAETGQSEQAAAVTAEAEAVPVP